MTETVVFPATFTPGFMGFATETEFMLDFTASMRDSGLKSYARTYAELVARQTRPNAEPKSSFRRLHSLRKVATFPRAVTVTVPPMTDRKIWTTERNSERFRVPVAVAVSFTE